MSKELTEQWRNGTLPRGGYYIKLLDGSIKQTKYDNINKTFDTEFFQYNVSVKEVLAPVPSYDEYNELVQKTHILEKQLEIVTKALKKINRKYRFTVAQDVVYKALKEMKGVK